MGGGRLALEKEPPTKGRHGENLRRHRGHTKQSTRIDWRRGKKKARIKPEPIVAGLACWACDGRNAARGFARFSMQQLAPVLSRLRDEVRSHDENALGIYPERSGDGRFHHALLLWSNLIGQETKRYF